MKNARLVFSLFLVCSLMSSSVVLARQESGILTAQKTNPLQQSPPVSTTGKNEQSGEQDEEKNIFENSTLVSVGTLDILDKEKIKFKVSIFLVQGTPESPNDSESDDVFVLLKYSKTSDKEPEETFEESISSDDFLRLDESLSKPAPKSVLGVKVTDEDSYTRQVSGKTYYFSRSSFSRVCHFCGHRLRSYRAYRIKHPRIKSNPTLHVGPRGGVYHYSASGKKVYEKRKR